MPTPDEVRAAVSLGQWIEQEIRNAYAQGCNSGFYYQCDPKLLEAARTLIYTKEDAEALCEITRAATYQSAYASGSAARKERDVEVTVLEAIGRARNIKLPPGIEYGGDALELFKFGGEIAATSIEEMLTPEQYAKAMLREVP